VWFSVGLFLVFALGLFVDFFFLKFLAKIIFLKYFSRIIRANWKFLMKMLPT